MRGLYLVTIAIYIAILWLTGAFVTRKSRSSEAYLLASRGLSTPLISVLIAGTWIGGVSVVGMAQGSYIHGISALWFQVGIWVAMVLTATLLPRIIEGRTTYSILDVVGALYDRKTARLAGILQLVFSVWCVTMQIVGGGAILSIILKGQLTFGQGMLLTAVVFTLYNAMGGFVATAYTNLIHIAAIFLGIFLGGFYVILHTGALSQMAGQEYYFTPFGDMGAFQALTWSYINLTLGVLAQPVINTAASAPSTREGRRGILIGNLLAIPVVIMAALCGIVAKYKFPDIPSLGALPSLLEIVPPWIGVFFLISMWAPLMSSGSPFLMGATTLAVKGYIAPALKIGTDQRLLLVSRFTTIAIGLLALLLGFFVKEILREITWLAVFLSAIVYIVFFGWFGRKVGSGWAYAALLGTLAIVVLFFLTGWHTLIHPFWPVTAYVFLVMFIGLAVTPRRTPAERSPT
jgi:solute:Na+ symporter, SSS family